MLSIGMFSILLPILITIIVPIIAFLKTGDGGITALTVVITFLVSIIFSAIITNMLYMTTINEKQVSELRNALEVKSISDNFNYSSHIEGSFFLGCGSVVGDGKTSLVYYVMTGNNENGFTVNKFNTETTHLFLDGDKRPYYVEKWNVKLYDKIIKIFGIVIAKDSIREDILVQQELHIPQNTVKVQYNIDLK